MNIAVRQRDASDCGPACLAAVAKYYGLSVSPADMRLLAGTDRQGTSLRGMNAAAERLGFESRAVRGEVQSLDKIPLPAIAFICRDGSSHFVVINKVGHLEVNLMDPDRGRLLWKDKSAFLSEWEGILILLIPSIDFKGGGVYRPVWQRFIQLLHPHKFLILRSLAGAIIFTLLGLAMSVYIRQIVDLVLPNSDQNLLSSLSAGMILILMLQFLTGVVKDICSLRTGQLIDSNLVMSYYRHILQLPQTFFDSLQTGEISSRMGDALKIRVFVNDVMQALTVNVLIIVTSILLMFSYYWKLALIMLTVLPMYSLVFIIVNYLNKRILRRVMERGAVLESQLVESLTAVRTIKAFGAEEPASRKTEDLFRQFLKSVYKAGLVSVYSLSSLEMISRVFTVILLWLGATFVMEDRISQGELLSFYTLALYFTGPAVDLIGMNSRIQDAVIAADRLFEIMDIRAEDNDTGQNLEAEPGSGIKVSKLSFAYAGGRPLLQDLDTCFEEGRISALMGPPGCGKSTLLSLIAGLYPIQQGSITFGRSLGDGRDRSNFRKWGAIVPQQIDLLSDTIAGNICMSEPPFDMQKMEKICAHLGLLELISKLPDGFDTRIGARGVNLSGGQKQLLGVARALYRDPALLLMDEPSSALDEDSEIVLGNYLTELSHAGMTIIIATHRQKLLEYASKVIKLDI